MFNKFDCKCHIYENHIDISWGFWAHFYRDCFSEYYIRKTILNEAASIAHADEDTDRQ